MIKIKTGLLTIIGLFTGVLLAQNSVKWENSPEIALQKAAEEGKIAFVEAFLPTCPACQAVEPNFKNTEVAAFYNENFYNHKLDLSLEGTRKFLDDRKIYIPSFPQFLFFDSNGNLIHQAEVMPEPGSLLEAAKDALDPFERSANYKNRFEAGNRDLDFLVKYGIYARLMSDTTANHRVGNAIFSNFPKNKMDSDQSWYVLQKVVTTVDNGFFLYWIDHMNEAKEMAIKSGHPGMEMNILGSIVQASLLSKEINTYDLEKLALMREYMNKIGAGRYADNYIWEAEALAKIRNGNPEAALEQGQGMVDKFGYNAPSLIYISKFFIENYPNDSFIPKVHGWLAQAKPNLSGDNYLAEYYYELSRLYLKEGKTSEAKTEAAQALKRAQSAKVNLKKFEELHQSFL